MRYVYLFHEGNARMKELLGGKGANLAEMTNIGLPEGTEKLDWSVFASCTSLSSVTIPSSVKTIDVYAFNKCPLKEVKISKDCVLGSQAFGKDVKIKYYH